MGVHYPFLSTFRYIYFFFFSFFLSFSFGGGHKMFQKDAQAVGGGLDISGVLVDPPVTPNSAKVAASGLIEQMGLRMIRSSCVPDQCGLHATVWSQVFFSLIWLMRMEIFVLLSFPQT